MDRIKAFGGVAIISLIIAVIAVVLSSRGTAIDEAEIAKIERRVYQKMLDETWQEVKPAYADFGLATDHPPASFGELIGPLVKVKPLQPGKPNNP